MITHFFDIFTEIDFYHDNSIAVQKEAYLINHLFRSL